jgi:hypothetical protein
MNSFSDKKTAEVFDLQIDFTALLAPLETISVQAWSCLNSTTGLADNTLLVSGISRVTGSICSQRVSGGEAGSSYIFSCQVTTSTGRVYVEQGKLNVVA